MQKLKFEARNSKQVSNWSPVPGNAKRLLGIRRADQTVGVPGI
jgi:hypothetical protein